MRTALITIAHGRHDHLAAQAAALARSVRCPDQYVVVAMDDPAVASVVPEADVVHVGRVQGSLPLAAARNAGAERALADGADLLVLLDVDCVPAPALVGRYEAVADELGGVLSGPVGYLPPAPPGGHDHSSLHAVATPHPARPVPGEDEVLPAEDPDLFWSLSFAAPATTWRAVGGFCEEYRGYGGEDTDFGHTLAAAGVPRWWVGGAWAFHQHHGSAPGPPVQHLDDVLRNAAIFHRRWGRWPMQGWLEGFEQLGLASVDPATGAWVRA